MSRHRMRYLTLLLASGTILSAQTTGALQGRVLDSKGNAVAGARVAVTGVGVQGERATVTDASGAYRIGLLPPGSVTVTVTKEGLNTAKAQVQVGLDKTATVELKMAAVAAATVEVLGTSTVVDTKATTSGGELHRRISLEAERVPRFRQHRPAGARCHHRGQHAQRQSGREDLRGLRR